MEHKKTNLNRHIKPHGGFESGKRTPSLNVILALILPLLSGASIAASDTLSILPSGMVPAQKNVTRNAQATETLSVRIAQGSQPASVIVEFINDGNFPVKMLRDGTPFDDVPGGDILRIIPAGKVGFNPQKARYIGPVYRRLPVDASRFVEIAPSESLQAEIDITEHYQVAADGAYRVSYAGTFEVVDTGAMRASIALADQATTWKPNTGSIELGLTAEPLAFEPRAQPAQFDNCTAVEQRVIDTATLSGEAITNESVESLRNTPVQNRETSPRYTTWFGIYTPPNYGLVSAVYERMASVLTNESITYRCSPPSCSSSSTIAYVQPFLREDINLCPLYFDESRLSDEDRAATIVHELSHLLRIGNTDDLAYGATASAALADNSTIDALKNADNYTLFAANNAPTLPMIGDGSNTDNVPDDDVPTGGGITFVPLAAGSTARNQLAEGQASAFSVSAIAALELTSITGDADLYVFNSPGLEQESLVCSSIEASADTTIDSCQITGNEEHFVVVYAFKDTSYALEAITRSNDTPPVAQGAVELVIGDVVSGNLGEREALIYTATVPGRIVLTSLAGDADLYVFSDSSLTEDTLICRSLLQTPEDSCDVSGTGRVHIGVAGIQTQNSFQLALSTIGSETGPVAGPGTGPAPNDGTNQPPLATASSGGGSFGLSTLIMLTGLATIRRAFRHIKQKGHRS